MLLYKRNPFFTESSNLNVNAKSYIRSYSPLVWFNLMLRESYYNTSDFYSPIYGHLGLRKFKPHRLSSRYFVRISFITTLEPAPIFHYEFFNSYRYNSFSHSLDYSVRLYKIIIDPMNLNLGSVTLKMRLYRVVDTSKTAISNLKYKISINKYLNINSLLLYPIKIKIIKVPVKKMISRNQFKKDNLKNFHNYNLSRFDSR